MNTHYGETIERTIRRNGYSISELARTLNVNRRTIYNWFLQRNLKAEIIYRVGCALRHDFSAEFPHLFTPEDFKLSGTGLREARSPYAALSEDATVAQNLGHWKNKYISLLEEYNSMLLNQVGKSDPSLLHDLHS
ncbi:Homeodomain-like domain-containing protein [Anseongella ginsenosidimutans]|uniref:Homeodomain-like domain-containing protein n=1 Tax=Anseongella ginsenosidimutans TaxID=496056 RepID=A0A4R3KPJ1_9SPHI|nr:helix-turn-helix domain-containing protein [Anseongella ginsenosidimutans]QEC53963.1 hypothetical protein FRZ59_17590 [Anseongella ginsenosidimutans]TCS86349.1 Homeodomain-like domain-containing protein [Anseongella ginsenosidimutans]